MTVMKSVFVGLCLAIVAIVFAVAGGVAATPSGQASARTIAAREAAAACMASYDLRACVALCEAQKRIRAWPCAEALREIVMREAQA